MNKQKIEIKQNKYISLKLEKIESNYLKRKYI